MQNYREVLQSLFDPLIPYTMFVEGAGLDRHGRPFYGQESRFGCRVPKNLFDTTEEDTIMKQVHLRARAFGLELIEVRQATLNGEDVYLFAFMAQKATQ